MVAPQITLLVLLLPIVQSQPATQAWLVSRMGRSQDRPGIETARVHRIDVVVGDAAKEVVVGERVEIEPADVVLFDVGFGSIEAETGGVQQVALVAAKVVRRGIAAAA